MRNLYAHQILQLDMNVEKERSISIANNDDISNERLSCNNIRSMKNIDKLLNVVS